MRHLVSLVLAVLVPACSDPATPAEHEGSSSGDGTSSSSSEESSTTGCYVSEHGWCTETCIVPSGPEVVAAVGLRAGNLCSVVSHVVVSLEECRKSGSNDCWRVVAEIYGGGTFTYEPTVGVMETVELWEVSRLWFEASGFAEGCVALEPSCETISYEDCMATTRGLEGVDIDMWRDYACREIAARYPAAGLPPEDWPD